MRFSHTRPVKMVLLGACRPSAHIAPQLSRLLY